MVQFTRQRTGFNLAAPAKPPGRPWPRTEALGTRLSAGPDLEELLDQRLPRDDPTGVDLQPTSP
jgi:hypothetical protein